MNFNDPEQVERLIIQALREIIKHEDFDHLLAWMRREAVITPQNPLLPEINDHLGPMTTWMALNIWNATPLPGNGFKTRPVEVPKRNQKCICGSGLKYKRCCLIKGETMPPMDETMIWPILLEIMPKSVLKKALQDEALPLKARIVLAGEHLDDDRPDLVADLLLNYYFGASHNDTGDMAAYGLSILCDALTTMDMNGQKMELISHLVKTLPSSPLRAEALQRLATIQADQGDFAAAFASLKKARKDDPNNIFNGVIEVQIHLLNNDITIARQRARFVAKQIERHADENDDLPADPMLVFLTAVIENPEAMANMMKNGPEPDYAGLARFFEKNEGRPPLACKFKELKGFVYDEDFNPAGDRPSFMTESSPKLKKVEAGWRKVSPAPELFGTQLFPDPSDDPWFDMDDEPWQEFLVSNPEALDSIVIIDELLTLCTMHDDWMEQKMMTSLYEPILARGVELVEESLAGLPEGGCLPWLVTENRPLLRILIRDISKEYQKNNETTVLKQLRQVFELNPWDNHGLRRDIINIMLINDDNEAALELSERFPDEILPDILYGRALALFRLGHLKKAERAARTAKKRLPRVASYLVAPRRAEPKEFSPFGIISGGKMEAWEYRQAMRQTWKATRGSLTWLKKIG